MTLLGNITEEDEDIYEENGKSSVPSVYKNKPEGISFKKAVVISTIAHPAFLGFIALVLLILTLLGISLDMFKRPEMPKKDIEFVLVTKEGTPIDKNTRNRADKNSRAGGKHDPRRPVSEPQAASPKQKPQAASPAPAPKQSRQQPKQPAQQQPKQVQQPQKTPAQALQDLFKPSTEPPKAAPVPTTPRPTQTAPKPTVNPKSTMQIPFPKTADYSDIGPASGGPVAGTSSGSTSKGGSSSGTGIASAPTPSFSPSASGSGSSGSGTAGRAGSSGGGGNVGNPGPGNPNGAPGIDAIKEPDFGPYMKELQRRIKMNWTPPKGNESKRVVLLFSISRDGRLLNVKVHKSSGLPSSDQAAIQAVQLTAPFRPLPPEYRGDSVDIQFTFDYNVFGASRY